MMTMAIRSAGSAPMTSLLLLLLVVATTVEAFAPTNNAFAKSSLSSSSSRVTFSPITITARPLTLIPSATSSSSSSSTSILHMNKNINEDKKFYTPLDRPLLAIIDTISLIIFAAIGKSSHAANGALDPLAILITAFPFITAWLATSPLTGVYSPDDRDNNLLSSTALKVGKGWILAVPLGIVGRGMIKGYVPPVPFIIVTLIATLVILAGVRILFSLVEDFFVEMV